MTEPSTVAAETAASDKPPERRLHDGLARISAAAKRHDSPALRDLAQLRRAHGRFGEAGPADSTLLRLLGPLEDSVGGRPVQAFLDDAMLVAWLVATARPTVGLGWGDHPSFGADFRHVRVARDSASTEQLMNRLLASTREDIGRPLQRAVPLLASTPDRSGKPGRLDAHALIRDLGDWSREDRAVQRRWAFDFWSIPSKSQPGDDAEDASAPIAETPSTPDAGR